MAFLFEKLDVYNLSLEFNRKVMSIYRSKRLQGHYYIADQFRRTALSISLNIAEGNGRFHRNDRRNFFWIARGAAFECIPILTLCKDNEFLTATEVDGLRSDIERISQMLSGLVKED